MLEVIKMHITTSNWSRNSKSQLLSAFSQSRTCVLNHCQPHGSANNNGIENSKDMISGKHVQRDIPVIDVGILYSTSLVVLQAFIYRWNEVVSARRLAWWNEDASGITVGTLGTHCLPDTDCGLVKVHPPEKIGSRSAIVNTIPFLSTQLSLKETSCSKVPVATKHHFSFKGKEHRVT